MEDFVLATFGFESGARAHRLYVTAGSDFHGSVKPDIALGQETRGGAYLEESMVAFVSLAGMAEILNKPEK